MSSLFRRNITCCVIFRANIFPEKINCCLAQTHHGHIMATLLQHRVVWSGFFCLPKSTSQLAHVLSSWTQTYVQSIFPTQRGTMSYSWKCTHQLRTTKSPCVWSHCTGTNRPILSKCVLLSLPPWRSPLEFTTAAAKLPAGEKIILWCCSCCNIVKIFITRLIFFPNSL